MQENIQKTATSRDFARDLQSMLQEAEALLKNAGQQIRNDYRAARERVSSTVSTSLNEAKQSLTTVEDSVVTKARDTARNTNDFVQTHPWQAVGVSACLGFLIGVLATRR